MKRGFSIIEVLFAVAFLIMVGLAMISLNAAALRLINSAELQTVANGLNEESVAVVAVAKKTTPNFSDYLDGLDCKTECYVECPADNLSEQCKLTKVNSPVQLGRNTLQFNRSLKIKQIGSTDAYIVQATVRWGKGASKESRVSEVIQ